MAAVRGQGSPELPRRSNFRFHLLLHELILDGPAAFTAGLRNPGTVAARAERQTPVTELHFIAVVHNELIRFHSRTFRILERVPNVYIFDLPLPGSAEFRAVLTAYVPPDEGTVPNFALSESGEWTLDGTVPCDASLELSAGVTPAQAEACARGSVQEQCVWGAYSCK